MAIRVSNHAADYKDRHPGNYRSRIPTAHTSHDFYRTGEETVYSFDMVQTMRKGHDFKDYICPDTFEFEKDYFRMGDRYGRVIFLREYV